MKKALVTVAGITAITGVASQAFASEYNVKSGDTLWAIAQENGTSVDALKALNNLDGDLILVGQKLNVEDTKTYTVKKGDTLKSIASQFDLTVGDLMNWNNLTSDIIEVGTELKLTAPESNGEVKAETSDVQTVTQTAAPVEAPVTTSEATQTYEAPAQQSYTQANEAPAQGSYTQANEAPAQQSYKAPARSYNTPVNGNIAQIANSVAAGKSYVYGANSATAVDCSAFAQQVLAAQGKSIPRTTYAQMAAGTRVSTPQAGDLVFFNGGSHVGVYIGNGQMIDALNPSEGIGQRAVSYVNGTVDGYYRF
ncbi:LysM peptidoglycan-binding domain-containing protein [Macrococcus armenti]|uniref:LysM peptidoglycan-binding domain-containing protein n=1 Tax=Macrococcus armenti TaxID=2875764 RepID=A0ABY3ZVV9_9STAP|nr:LysM peptidoglycan-binding domain-containing protein [Macrococcus armenti]UOB21048.1 LysM peptidoglycan-binding domain-containing protein [Macrococcus armenti]